MPTTLESINLGIRHVRDQRLDLRILLEEVQQIVGAILGTQRLILAIDRLGEALQQGVVGVPGKQRVPVRAPDHLDHIPASAGKQGFKFLNDLAVTAHRAIQTLQVAVDDKGQVVELLPRREREPGNRLGLIHFTVTKDAPDMALGGVGQVAVFEVTHVPRLIDRTDRADAHRSGRELPEVRHQPRVRI